jgi:hypothetical protein
MNRSQECLGCGHRVDQSRWLYHSQVCLELEKIVLDYLTTKFEALLSLEGFEHEAE